MTDFASPPSAGGGGSSNVDSVATIAALRARSVGAAGSVCETRGYYTSGDGGGALFEWNAASSATDNGATVITPSSAPATGRWLIVPTRTVNILQFGARGTTSVDDHPAGVAALAYLNTIGGGVLEIPGDGRIYLWPIEVYVLSNTTVRGTGARRPILHRTAIAASNTTGGFFAIRNTAPAVVQNATVENINFTHAAIDQTQFTATAAQTVFTYDTTGVTSAPELVVFRDGVLQSPSTPDFTYTGSTVTLSTPCTAGQLVRIGKVRAGHRCAAVYSEGVSFSQPNVNIAIRNIGVDVPASLYCGVVWLYTNGARFESLSVRGVANRGVYNYGLTNNVFCDDMTVDGRPSSGIFSGLSVTDYAIDNNQFDANNGATDVRWTNVTMNSCLRGFSWGGTQTRSRLQTFSVGGMVTVGILIQDLAQQSDRIFIADGQIANTGQDALLCNAGLMQASNIVIDGCQRGVVLTNGALGSIESRNILNGIRVATFSVAGFDIINQYFLDATGLFATAGGASAIALKTTGSQYCSFLGFKADNVPGTAISLSATCFRHDLDHPILAVGGVALNIGGAGALHQIRDGRANGFTTAIVGAVGTSIVRYTDAAGVNQAGFFTT
jgi:hypothetical protein